EAGGGGEGGWWGKMRRAEARRWGPSRSQMPTSPCSWLVTIRGVLAGQDGAVVFELGGRGSGGEPSENVLDGGPVDGVVHVARRVHVGRPQGPVPAGLRRRRGMGQARRHPPPPGGGPRQAVGVRRPPA